MKYSLPRRKPRRPTLSAAPQEVHRLDALVSRWAGPAISVALFSGVHTPNGLLMAVTLPTGYVCARIYRRYPNLYFPGAAHATVGFLLFLVVPDSISPAGASGNASQACTNRPRSEHKRRPG